MPKEFHVIGNDEGVTVAKAIQLHDGGVTIYGNKFNPPAGIVTMAVDDIDVIVIRDEEE